MLKNVYISTSAFKTKKLNEIIDICLENGLTNLELGSNVDQSEDSLDLIFKYNMKPMRFILHNYFPRPKEDFVINLASNDDDILGKSLALCKTAIDISSQIGAPFYSLHAGLALNASPNDLGRPLTKCQRIPYRQAYETFVASVLELIKYASPRKVKLAIENNVVAGFNQETGAEKIGLLTEAEESLSFLKEISSDLLYLLIDMGHLKVTAETLHFDPDDYIRKLAPYAAAYHLSENNGQTDQHLSFSQGVWFENLVSKYKEKTFIIEAVAQEIPELIKCYSSMENMLN